MTNPSNDTPSNDAVGDDTPISLIDLLLLAFGLFLMYMAYGSYAESNFLGAASDFLLGLAGVMMGVRNPIQHSLQRPLPMLNTIAVVSALAGIVLFGATFFQ
ncbi:MAG: hypothetical protein R6U20_10690 [Longimonas sp.]|uniref:hypothetical protein n=1 Tax=Longimonas sp. TaxID=2039626 RepID=UPI003975E638